MENLFYRILRYLKYPADTNGKVLEIWQRMRALSENFRLKVDPLENEIGNLRNQLNNVQHQLNDVQHQLYQEKSLVLELTDKVSVLPKVKREVPLPDLPGTHFVIQPCQTNKASAVSIDWSRLDGSEDLILLFTDPPDQNTEFPMTIHAPANSGQRVINYARLAEALSPYRVSQVIAVAKSAEGLFAAAAVADVTGKPAALLLPDDREFLANRQTDQWLAEAIDKSRIAFSPSVGLCAHVQSNLGKKLWFLLNWFNSSRPEGTPGIPANNEILAWIFDALEDGFPPTSCLSQLKCSADLNGTVPYIDPPAPRNIRWSMHSYFQALYRLAQMGYQPDFIMDVGASTGYWSHIANRVFPRSRFYLIEPLLERYQQVNNSIYYSHPEFITVACAAGDKPGQLEFNVSPDLYSSSFLDGPELSPDRQWDRVKVPVRTLDEISATLSIKGRGLLKIDVQLSEHLVLDGAIRFLEQVDVVCIELGLLRFAPTSKNFLDMLTKFQDLGFEYFDSADSWRDSKNGRMIQQDTVFVRSSLSF